MSTRPLTGRSAPFAVVALSLALSGCGLLGGTEGPAETPVVQQIERTGTAAWDLRTPLSRGAAGVRAGEDVLTLGDPAAAPIATALTLPGGATLRVPANGIDIQFTRDRAGVNMLNTLTLTESAADPAAARDRMLAAAKTLKLDRKRIQGWYARAAKGSDQPSVPVGGTELDYLRVEVAATSAAAAPPQLQWRFTWD